MLVLAWLWALLQGGSSLNRSTPVSLRTQALALRRQLLLATSAPQIGDRGWVQDHDVADAGEYTCKDLQFWLHSEKHYSNQETYAQLLALAEAGAAAVPNCSNAQSWVLKYVSFGSPQTSVVGARAGKVYMRYAPASSSAMSGDAAVMPSIKCRKTFRKVVIFLSNFSINNNFSHFLHALLRLFCALIDARLLVWDRYRKAFVQPEPYTLWLDERVRLDAAKMEWLRPLSYRGDIQSADGQTSGSVFESSARTPILQLRDVREGAVCAEEVIYGSGCVKLLPPEKWFGYDGCRARYVSVKVLSAILNLYDDI
jgi:hypothetical protein